MSRRGGGPGGRPNFAARRDLPQADKVDSLRDALYPRRVNFDRHGLPRATPWTVTQVAELAGMSTGGLADGSDEGTTAAAVARTMKIPASNSVAKPAETLAEWGPRCGIPPELLETGKVRQRKPKRLQKPIRRGGIVVMPEAPPPRKATRAEGDKDGSGSGSDKSDGSDNEDALSGLGGSDDDGDSGASGDELTL